MPWVDHYSLHNGQFLYATFTCGCLKIEVYPGRRAINEEFSTIFRWDIIVSDRLGTVYLNKSMADTLLLARRDSINALKRIVADLMAGLGLKM